ncbi:CDP-glycerol glycerophosphotransferase family protein [Oceanospirillaceae bacterium]|nr:CDP-glycerol glycerophosphotransferase family protein [Oceanospirillaceae bacterium]
MNDFLRKTNSLIEAFLTVFLPSILVVIPKQKNLWIFTAWSGLKFEDNAKAMYEHIVANESGQVTPIYLVKSKVLNEKLKSKGIDSYYCYSVKGLKYQLIASKVFFTHNIGGDLYRPFIAKNTIRINMWHGMPVKKIRFDDDVTYSPFRIKLISSRLYQYISNEYYDHILSLGDSSTVILSSAFSHPKNKFIGTGFPRNDALVKYNKNEEKIVLTYMPTFRNDIGSDLDLIRRFHIDVEQSDKLLGEYNAELIIKIHPANRITLESLKTINVCKNIKLENDDASDILTKANGIITDYSSVMYDASSSLKSVYLFCPDYEEYFSEQRDSYIDKNIFMSELFFTRWDECLKEVLYLESSAGNESNIPSWLLNYHKYDRGVSCHNLYQFIYNKYN